MHYPLLKEHQDLHRQLLNTVRGMGDGFHSNEVGIRELFEYLSKETVASHVMNEDTPMLVGLFGNEKKRHAF
jgi:hemerythrin